VLKVFLIDRAGDVREIYTSTFLYPRLVLNDIETLLMEEDPKRGRAPRGPTETTTALHRQFLPRHSARNASYLGCASDCFGSKAVISIWAHFGHSAVLIVANHRFAKILTRQEVVSN